MMGNDKEKPKDKPKTKMEIDESTFSPLKLKPLTTGLGFKDRVKEKNFSPQIVYDPIPDADGGDLDIGNEDGDSGTVNVNHDGTLTLSRAEKTGQTLFHSGHDGLIKKSPKKSTESFFSAFIDVLFSVAATMFLSAVLIELNILNFDVERLINFNLNELAKIVIVFVAMLMSYKVLARSFWGRTLGEWANHQQLGSIVEQNRWSYMFKVFTREVFTVASGVFVFPILSTLFSKDVGYFFSGLHTYIEQKK